MFCVYVFPILSGARMRMRELSLRQDPDLRKELALLARGCDFVLPSRFKKRLRAFQQGQAGVRMSVLPTTLVLLACQLLFLCVTSNSSQTETIVVVRSCCIQGRLGQRHIAPLALSIYEKFSQITYTLGCAI